MFLEDEVVSGGKRVRDLLDDGGLVGELWNDALDLVVLGVVQGEVDVPPLGLQRRVQEVGRKRSRPAEDVLLGPVGGEEVFVAAVVAQLGGEVLQGVPHTRKRWEDRPGPADGLPPSCEVRDEALDLRVFTGLQLAGLVWRDDRRLHGVDVESQGVREDGVEEEERRDSALEGDAMRDGADELEANLGDEYVRTHVVEEP